MRVHRPERVRRLCHGSSSCAPASHTLASCPSGLPTGSPHRNPRPRDLEVRPITMSAPRTRTRRVLGRAMRAPAALDRPRLRWLLGWLSPAPIVVLVHRGRRTGKTYKTPVEAIAENAERGEIVISPMWGASSDWYRNVLAGGLLEVRT